MRATPAMTLERLVSVIHRLAVAALLLGVAAMPRPGAAQSVFRGEDVLAFAERLQAGATPASVHAALDRMLDRLEVAADRRESATHLKLSRIQRIPGGTSLESTRSAIILSAGAVKIGRVDDVLIIAEGDVEVGEGRNAVVVSRGSIKVVRESAPGIYIARRTIAIEGGISPIVYAVDGARVSSREPFAAYNTAVKIEGGFLSYQYTRPPLFQGEPIRPPEEVSMQVNSGESVPHSGKRCKSAFGDSIDVLSQLLPHARRRGNCAKVDSATVRCEQEDVGAARSGSRELWTVQLCGREMALRVESTRTGKTTESGEPVYDHSITVQSGAAPARAPRTLPGKPTAFAAEDALALAGVPAAQLPRDRVTEAVRRVFSALGLPPDLQAKYAFIGSARLQVEPGFAEATRLSETILVADGAVKVAFARNSIVIARGPVEIAHGGGLIVIADGPVSLSHETPHTGAAFVPGVYVSRESVEISHSAGPVIYGVQGSKNFGYGRATLINTTFAPATSRADPAAYTVPPLFSGEPSRISLPKPLPTSAPLAYSGTRCPRVWPDEPGVLHRAQAYATKEAGCNAVDAAAVECLQAPEATNRYTSIERWTIDLCNRKVKLISRVTGYVHRERRDDSSSAMSITNEMNVERPLTPLQAAEKQWRETYEKLSPADTGRYEALSREVSALNSKGFLVEARDKRREADAVVGMPHWSTMATDVLTLDTEIARVDAAAATLTRQIERGKADARTYVQRGMIYLHGRDRSRGLRDLERAVELSRRDPAIVAEYAWGLLITLQYDDAEKLINDVLRGSPNEPRALEIRAWMHFFANRPTDAFNDAVRGLPPANAWTAREFAAKRAGYRAIIGYFALHQSASREKAREWLRQWKPLLAANAWPDAAILFLLGDSGEEAVTRLVNGLDEAQRRHAAPEFLVFQAIDVHLSSNPGQAGLYRFYQRVGSGYSASRLLSRGLSSIK